MDKKPIVVCVTGAAGQIAYSFQNLLCSGQVFGLDQPIYLRLLDIEPCVPILNGLKLELEDCAYKLVKCIQIGHDPYVLFKDADVCIFFGGFPRKPGMERKDLMQMNNKIFKQQGIALNVVANKSCKSIVIANPANTNCLTLARYCPSIPKKNFTCLTRLDHNRALAQLALKAGTTVENVKNVTIWGNHSSTQFPDFFNAVIGDKLVTDIIKDENYLKNEFIPKIQKRGAEILEARKNSSVMSAANATKDHIRSWFFGTAPGEWVSMGVYTEGSPYGITDDLIFSFPVKCNNFEWEIVKGLNINDFSKEKINKTMQELIEERQEAFSVVYKNTLNVCVTGAAGQIGYALLNLLGQGMVFGPDQPLSLRLLDIEQCVSILKGVQMELEDCAYPLVKSIETGSDPLKLFKDVDVLICLGGFPRKPGMERKDLMQINNKIYKEQAKALNEVANKNCKVVVVANPANTNCLTLALNCPNIPKKNFTCLTRLDHNRALAQLASKSQTTIDQVKNVIIWGNHSSTQFPDFYHAQIGGQPVTEIIKDQHYLQTDFITRVQKRGAEVLEARKNSSVMSAAYAVCDHLNSWFLGTKEGQWVSMGVFTEGKPYGIEDELIFSFPVKCTNFEWQIVPDLAINEFAKQKIELTMKELKEEKQESLA